MIGDTVALVVDRSERLVHTGTRPPRGRGVTGSSSAKHGQQCGRRKAALNEDGDFNRFPCPFKIKGAVIWDDAQAVVANKPSAGHVKQSSDVDGHNPVGKCTGANELDIVDLVPIDDCVCIQLDPQHVNLDGMLADVWAENSIPLLEHVLLVTCGACSTLPEVDKGRVTETPTLNARDGTHPPVLADPNFGGEYWPSKFELNEIGIAISRECC
eukprot:4765781-Prymnesium_polylepis.3